MSEDLTKKVPDPEADKLTLILNIVRTIESHGAILLQIIERLDKLTARVDAIESRLTAIETRLDAIETRIGAIETRLNGFETRLQSLEQSVYKRLEPRTSPTNSQT